MNKQFVEYKMHQKMRFKEAQERVLNTLRHPLGIWEDDNGKMFWKDPVTGIIEKFDPKTIEKKYELDLGFKMYAQTQEEAQSQKLADAKYKQLMEQRAKNKKLIDLDRGPFVFACWAPGTIKRNEILGPKVKPETLARLTLLSGYLRWQDHHIMRESISNERHSRVRAKKRDIKKILGLASGTFDRFWTDATANGYIIGSETDGYELTGFYWRGRLNGTYAQRIYIDEYTQLYRNGKIDKKMTGIDDKNRFRALKPSDHKRIGRVITLLPYLHLQENVLCWNPWEEDNTKIDPLTDDDLAKLLGIDANNRARDLRDIRRMTLDVNGQEMYVLGRWEIGGGKEYMYMVNPAIVYFGDKSNFRRIIQSSWMYVKKHKKPEKSTPQTTPSNQQTGIEKFYSDIFQ